MSESKFIIMKLPDFMALPNGRKAACCVCEKDISLYKTVYSVRRANFYIGLFGTLFNKLTCSEECANMCILQNMGREGEEREYPVFQAEI